MLVRRTEPVPFECVVRGYLSGSAWEEYRDTGTLAGEPLPAGLIESERLDPPLFSPATKAESGHDVNVTFDAMAAALGRGLAAPAPRRRASRSTAPAATTPPRAASSSPTPSSSSASRRTASCC